MSTGGGYRHFFTGQHPRFDPHIDSNLYINLNNLPANTTMAWFQPDFKREAPEGEGVPIPVFVAGPLLALHYHNEDASDLTFDNLFSYRLLTSVDDPTPETPGCSVCSLVRWLLTQCPRLNVVLERLYVEEQIVVYEVLKEMCNRFLCKLLVVSEAHFNIIQQFNLMSLPFTHELRLPLEPHREIFVEDWTNRQANAMEWVNALIVLIRNEIDHRGMYTHVAGFLFANFIRILRFYVSRTVAVPNEATNSRFYFLEAIRHDSDSVGGMIAKMAGSIGPSLVEFGDDCNLPSEARPAGRPREENFHYMNYVKMVMQTILTMNLTALFYDDANPLDLLVHSCRCRESPFSCPCRFARFIMP